MSSYLDSFNEWVMDLFIKAVPTLLIGMFLLMLFALGMACCSSPHYESVCSHLPHYGRCGVLEEVWEYDPALQMVVTRSRQCPCVSNHGIKQ